MYIQVNEKAPLEQQIKQLKTQLEIILDNLEIGSAEAVSSLPEGGTEGQVLTNQGDGSAAWEDPTGGAAENGLPSGGTTNQLLAKNSNANYDGKWVAPYSHPANHSPSIISQDANNRFVTDTEIAAWNAKQAALGFTPENSSNKKTSLADNSDTFYPSQKAVKTAVDGKADTEHYHEIEDVSGLSTALSGKAGSTHNQAETTITFTDITDGNASSDKHGFLPKLGGGTTNFLRADGSWATPSGGSGVTDGDKGDVVVSGSGATWTLDESYITAIAGSNGDFYITSAITLVTNDIVRISFPAATNGASNARLSVDGGTTYKDIKWSTIRLASEVASRQLSFKYDGVDFVPLETEYFPISFTPVFLGTVNNPTVSYTRQFGSYIKKGRLVTMMIHIAGTISSVNGGTGSCKISLPIAPSGTGFYAVTVGLYSLMSTRPVNAYAAVLSGNPEIRLEGAVASVTTGHITLTCTFLTD